MFDGIVASRGPCRHCLKVRMLAHIPRAVDDQPYQVAYGDEGLLLCAGCIYRLVRLAQLLLRLEAVPARKAPRKPAKVRKPVPLEPVPVPEPAYPLDVD